MKKLRNLGRSLGKQEQKHIHGGTAQVLYTCTCSGGTGGQWVYNSGTQPPESVVSRDINRYCSTHQATCLWQVPPR